MKEWRKEMIKMVAEGRQNHGEEKGQDQQDGQQNSLKIIVKGKTDSLEPE